MKLNKFARYAMSLACLAGLASCNAAVRTSSAATPAKPPAPKPTTAAVTATAVTTTKASAAVVPTTTQPSTTQVVTSQPATRPATQPAGRIFAVTDPSSIGTVFNQVRAGDAVILHSGQHYTYSLSKARINDVYVMTDGQDYATLDAVRDPSWAPNGQDPLTLMLCNGWTFQGIHFTFPHRDPKQPDFQKLTAGNCAHLINSCDNHFNHCLFDFGDNDLCIEGNNVTGNTFDHCVFGASYAVPINGSLPHSQGVFMSGQVGTAFTDCDFEQNGWYPGVQDPNMFNHAVYNHDSRRDAPGNISGGYTCVRCRFYNASSSGPTGDAGGSFYDCVFSHCSNTPGAPNAWTTDGEIIGCVSVDGKLQSTSSAGQTVKIADNILFNAQVVISAPSNKAATRTAADVVTVSGNTCYGVPTPVNVEVPGGTNVITSDNVAKPVGPAADLLR